LGTAAAGYLYWLAATDRLSGNGPKDATERAALMESGWRPNSVKVGDSWVSFQLMQPLSVQMALVANSVEAWKEAGADPANGPDVAAKTFAKSIGSFLDQSFLSGLFDFVEAVNDPERSATAFAGRLASSGVPFTGAVRTAQQAADPVVRRPRTVSDTVKAGVPGLSTSVAPRIDRFGEVVTREGGPARRALDPFNVSSSKRDPVAAELARLGVQLSLPSARVSDQQVTRPQEVETQQRRGRAVRASLERLMGTPGYQRMSDTLKVEVVERAIQTARRRENQRIVRDMRQRARGVAAR
jgi:hypothetical protein